MVAATTSIESNAADVVFVFAQVGGGG